MDRARRPKWPISLRGTRRVITLRGTFTVRLSLNSPPPLSPIRPSTIPLPSSLPSPPSKDQKKNFQNHVTDPDTTSAINTYLSTFHAALTTLATSHPALLTTVATSDSPYSDISYFAPPAPSNRTLSIDTPLQNLLIRSTLSQETTWGQNTPFLTLLERWPSDVKYGQSESRDAGKLAALMKARVEVVLAGVMRDERVFRGVAGNGAFSSEEGGKVDWVGLLVGAGVF